MEVLHDVGDILLVLVLLLLLWSFVVGGFVCFVRFFQEFVTLRVVDKVDAVPDGFGVCGIALSFVTCSVFVVVGEYHAREGKEEFPAIGGFSWVG